MGGSIIHERIPVKWLTFILAFTTIPGWLVLLLWSMIEGMQVEQKDYLQVFRLQKSERGQRIWHEQEQPPYLYQMDVPCADAVDAKIFVIDDGTHSTMLLAEEY